MRIAVNAYQAHWPDVPMFSQWCTFQLWRCHSAMSEAELWSFDFKFLKRLEFLNIQKLINVDKSAFFSFWKEHRCLMQATWEKILFSLWPSPTACGIPQSCSPEADKHRNSHHWQGCGSDCKLGMNSERSNSQKSSTGHGIVEKGTTGVPSIKCMRWWWKYAQALYICTWVGWWLTLRLLVHCRLAYRQSGIKVYGSRCFALYVCVEPNGAVLFLPCSPAWMAKFKVGNLPEAPNPSKVFLWSAVCWYLALFTLVPL